MLDLNLFSTACGSADPAPACGSEDPKDTPAPACGTKDPE